MIKQKVTLMTAALALGTALGVAAGEPEPRNLIVEKQTVRFDDLDLNKPAGVAVLHWRLRVAASNVCFQDDSGLRGTQLRRKCRLEAMERALARVPKAVLAYHNEWKTGGADWLVKPHAPATQRLASGR